MYTIYMVSLLHIIYVYVLKSISYSIISFTMQRYIVYIYDAHCSVILYKVLIVLPCGPDYPLLSLT